MALYLLHNYVDLLYCYCLVLMDNIKYGDGIFSHIPGVFFLFCANYLLHRYADYIIADLLGWNLQPWAQKIVIAISHIYTICTWVVFVAVFRDLTDYLEDNMHSPAGQMMVRFVLAFCFAFITILPFCMLIFILILEMVTQGMLERLDMDTQVTTELGTAEILALNANLAIPPVNYRPAYSIKKSASAFYLRDIQKSKDFRKTKSEVIIRGKISRIEDM